MCRGVSGLVTPGTWFSVIGGQGILVLLYRGAGRTRFSWIVSLRPLVSIKIKFGDEPEEL